MGGGVPFTSEGQVIAGVGVAAARPNRTLPSSKRRWN